MSSKDDSDVTPSFLRSLYKSEILTVRLFLLPAPLRPA